MIARVVALDADTHQAVQALLPWYLDDRLEPDERARLETHLAGCAHCRAELDWERRLQALMTEAAPTTEPSADIGAALAAMRLRLDQPQADWRTALQALVAGWQAGPRWMRRALAAQGALLTLLLVTLVMPVAPPNAVYHALGAGPPAAAGALIVVRFRPDTAEAALRGAVRDSDARLVDGPTSADAYVLQVPVAAQASALARLRQRPDVLLAEPLVAGPPR